MGAMTFTPVLRHFRWYDDDGSESGSTAAGAEDTSVDFTVSADLIKHLRVLIEETGGANGANSDDWKLQYNKNSAGWNDVTASSSNVQSDSASQLSEGTGTSNRATDGLTDPGGSFAGGEQDDTDGVHDNLRITSNNFVENVWAFKFIEADLADNDSIDFRVQVDVGGGFVDFAHDVTPNATIDKPLAVTPGAASAVGAKIDPGVALGSTSATPGPVTAIAAKVDPAVVLGSMTVAPAPAAAIAAKIDPVVIRGSLVLVPGPAAVIAAIIDPVVALGSTTATPVPVSVVVATIDPLVLAGGTFITPGPAGAIGDTVDPIVPMPDVLRWVEKMRHAIPSLKLSHRRIFHVGPRH